MKLRAVISAGAILAAALLAGRAGAETVDFLGTWSNGEADASGIARIVVSPREGSKASIHLYGRCQPVACDWGTEPARAYADDPASNDIRSLAADFDVGGVHRRVVLHMAVGHALRFEVQTDFPDGSGRNNYASNGAVTYAGDWRGKPLGPTGPTTPVGPSGEVPSRAAVGAATAPPPAPSSSWFGSSSFVGLGPAAPAGYAPAAGEDCRPFDPAQLRAFYVEGQWRLGDFSHRLLSFEAHQAAARLALVMMAYYHFDEQCFVGHDSAAMLYWKRAGEVPKPDMPGQDCVALNPQDVATVESDGTWHVVSGGTTLLEYDDKDDAARAVSVIRTYRLNRQCFFARPDSRAQYWLSQ